MLWIDDFIEQLGHNKTDQLKVYWCLPGKSVQDGLRVVKKDADTNCMMSMVPKYRSMVIYLDHQDIIGGINWDDILAMPVAELLAVMSPQKLPTFYDTIVSPKKKTNSENDPVLDKSRNDNALSHVDYEDNDDDPDFVDSDYEMEEGDDDLFENYVDEQVVDNLVGSKGKGKEVVSEDSGSENEASDEKGLQLPDCSCGEDGIKLDFKSFRAEVDMIDPWFKAGMVFNSVVEVQRAINEYSIKNRVAIKMPRNDKTRIRAHCVPSCPWELYASNDSRAKAF